MLSSPWLRHFVMSMTSPPEVPAHLSVPRLVVIAGLTVLQPDLAWLEKRIRWVQRYARWPRWVRMNRISLLHLEVVFSGGLLVAVLVARPDPEMTRPAAHPNL